MDSESRALSITGDGRLLIVGFADGTVASLSWSGKMREVSYPLDDATDFGAEGYPDAEQLDQLGRRMDALNTQSSGPLATPPGEQQQQRRDTVGTQPTTPGAGGTGATAFASAATVPVGLYTTYGRAVGALLPPSQLSRAIVQMRYCELSGQVVMVLADGAAAVCGAGEGGLSPLSDLSFGRWLCGPAQQAVCAQVGARAQLIAVGRESGEVALYRLYRTAIGSHGAQDGGMSPFNSGPLPEAYDGAAWEPPVRVLSLESWGHKVQQTGPVSQIEWSPDGRALAVGYAGQGVVVWSPSGCRLMCSLRQPGPTSILSPLPSFLPRGTISHQTSMAGRGGDAGRSTLSPVPSMGGAGFSGPRSYNGVATAAGPQISPQVPLDGGVSALCWGPGGYQLEVGELGAAYSGGSLLELHFAHSLPGQHRVARGGLGSSLADEEVHVLQGHDRLLIIREPGEAAMGVVPWATGDGNEPAVGQVGDLTVSHVPVPYSYVSSNWPLQHCAVSASGSDVAVAGKNGLAVYNRVTERWRLFGDISQERQVSCRAMGWLSSGVLVACSGPDPHAPPAPPPASGPLVMGGSGSTGAGGVSGSELLLLPRYHLDLTSLLARHPLSQPPMAMDCLGSHILLASEPLEITLLEVTVHGELSPTGDPRATISTLRQISMVDVGRYLSDVALVPLMPIAASAVGGGGPTATASAPSSVSSSSAAAAAASSSSGAGAMVAAPKQCVLLRWGGLLSVLDLEKGSEVALATEVEAFWLSDALTCQATSSTPMGGAGAWGAGPWPPAPPNGVPASGATSGMGSESSSLAALGAEAASGLAAAAAAAGGAEASSSSAAAAGTSAASAPASTSAATLDVEMPWWLYGPAGMQLCFPSSLTAPQSPHSFIMAPYKEGHDIELEFDQEVYPVGISLADDAIVGITQRIVRGQASLLTFGGAGGGASTMSASQLPCFHPIPESQPVLPCLLRRLLQRGAFKEAVMLARRHARGPHFARSLEWLLFTALEIETNTSSLTRLPVNSLLSAAAELVRHFPALFAEVVVSVARKTDAALWPPLFDAVGSPSLLLEGLVEAGELASAACFLLIIDRLEGAPAAQAQALRLMRSSLQRGQYPLCCELLRFVVPPSPAEADGRASTTELSFATSLDAPKQLTDDEAEPGAGPREASDSHAGGKRPSKAEGTDGEATPAASGNAQGGRTWLGWLLGYGSGPSAAAADAPGAKEEHEQPQSQQADATTSSVSDLEGPPVLPSVSRVQQTLAMLGDTGPPGQGRLPLPGNPSLAASGVAAAAAGAPGSPALAQMLLAAGAPSSSAVTARSACKLVAEHAWSLLESGHLMALGQLAQASAFLPCGLSGLMVQHRDSAYAQSGCASHAPLELLSALALAVSELPVWSSEEVEAVAAAVAALCREVGAVAWAVALAVLLVDASTVTAFRHAQPALWAQFVSMLHADGTFVYLWDIVEVLSGEAEDAAMAAAAAAAAAAVEGQRSGAGMVRKSGAEEADDEGADVGPLSAALRAAGGLNASVGHVEVRQLSFGMPQPPASPGGATGPSSEIEEAEAGPQSGVVYGGSAVLTAVSNITPHIAGAVDILVIEQPDGTRKASPFYGQPAPFGMQIGMYGQAYFAKGTADIAEGDEDEQEALLAGVMSPPSGYSSGADGDAAEAGETLSAVRRRISGMKAARIAGNGEGCSGPVRARGAAGDSSSRLPVPALGGAPSQTTYAAVSAGAVAIGLSSSQMQSIGEALHAQLAPALSANDRNESFLSAHETLAGPLGEDVVAAAVAAGASQSLLASPDRSVCGQRPQRPSQLGSQGALQPSGGSAISLTADSEAVSPCGCLHHHHDHHHDGYLHSTSAPLPSSAINAAAGAAAAASSAASDRSTAFGMAADPAAGMTADQRQQPSPGMQLSLCGSRLTAQMPYTAALEVFNASLLSEEAFVTHGSVLLASTELMVRLGNGAIYPWHVLSHSLVGLLAFGSWQVPPGAVFWAPDGAAPIDAASAAALLASAAQGAGAAAAGAAREGAGGEADGLVGGSVNTTPKRASGSVGSWLWPFGGRRDRSSAAGGARAAGGAGGRSPPPGSPVAERQASMDRPGKGPAPPQPVLQRRQSSGLPSESAAAEGAACVPAAGPGGGVSHRSGSGFTVTKKSLTPSAEQLAALDLKQGQNTITYRIGGSELKAYVYYLHWRTKIVISDIDGTITRSDVLGHLLPAMGLDWSHPGIAELLSNISSNNYQIMYLSSRSISQANITRDFINTLVQGQHRMPLGPVIISPHGLLPSLYREMILRRPHDFKIETLLDIRALFPPSWNPFYGGFGNRDTDEISYREVGVPPTRTFIINPRGELRQPVDKRTEDGGDGDAIAIRDPPDLEAGVEQSSLSALAAVGTDAAAGGARPVVPARSASAGVRSRAAASGSGGTGSGTPLSSLSAINQLVHDIFPPLQLADGPTRPRAGPRTAAAGDGDALEAIASSGGSGSAPGPASRGSGGSGGSSGSETGSGGSRGGAEARALEDRAVSGPASGPADGSDGGADAPDAGTASARSAAGSSHGAPGGDSARQHSGSAGRAGVPGAPPADVAASTPQALSCGLGPGADIGAGQVAALEGVATGLPVSLSA
ncbi:hypothetical protein GPECTOR_2g1446 [Gonium pectorale]|uniref:LNS2/PITP domain-containing protein n=1 Tax=Gonium pectorale TaxID=33097 RepID=A0A150H1E4_GONPE|nr:hypothetical protein GPECTOR_2g1446 [Gonium pectorale]|eukprot:KXZ55895.1 hypothetical protein GPECTOR_2g1446 [Gonium pectorale]